MGKLTRKDTIRVSELSKLDLSSEEIDRFTPQLAKVVDLMNQLDEVDTSDTDPISQTTKLENVLREDEIKIDNILTQDEALSGTENTKNGYITVKQILHND
jgi:aspartyl-tRNA(Asn)/glutamyl-tRNA(Gln) amidotransferase subunit C